MQKNVKGYIGLFSGLAAFLLCGIALFVPTNPISGTSLSLHGGANIAMALIAALLGIIAIIFGVMSRKDADKKGPRKAGVIIGIFAVIISLVSSGACALSSTIADIANGKNQEVLEQMDESTKESLNKYLEDLREQYPAK